ncbi:MAG: hypothetical protein JRH20_19485 [Deltaproteobacteria bacterium]|nr:hypothetical protein [Deltaproteobacteria bacterium]
MTKVWLPTAALLLCAMLAAGCRTAWNPPAPKGRNWAYKRQGAIRTFVSSSRETYGGWHHYRASFAIAKTHGSQNISPTQFWRSQFAWKRSLFNPHLGNYGERLEPGEGYPQLEASLRAKEAAKEAAKAKPPKASTNKRQRKRRSKRSSAEAGERRGGA